MPLIDHKRFATMQSHRRRRNLRPLLYGAGVALALFVVLNVVMAIAYHGRVLPRYSLSGVAVGNTSFGDLQKRVQGQIVPAQVTLTKNSTSRIVNTEALGISVDTAGSIADLKASRPLLPVLSLFAGHDVPARISIDDRKYLPVVSGLAEDFAKQPLMRRVVFSGSTFTTASEEPGYQMTASGLRKELISGLSTGKKVVAVPTTPLPPAQTTTDLNAETQKLQKKLGLKPAFTYSGKTIQPSARDIGGWYANDGSTMKLSAENIGKYLDSVAPKASNRSDLILAVQYAFGKDQSLTLAAAQPDAQVRTYCTSSRGVSNADLGDLTGKLAATYADPRGWGLGGLLAFQHVETGCEYTVWLSAPSEMTSFGEICDDYYNCQVGTNVIVNDDRWNKATEPWNATGASVEDYRVLIINHETGHRLGFLDNNVCPAAGGPAPVMMQQSVDLLGCTFSRFPNTTEIDTIKGQLGV